MKNRTFFVTGIVFLLFFVIFYGYSAISVKEWHLIHMLFSSDDLYQPIANDPFDFTRQGASTTRVLRPKYWDHYVVGIRYDRPYIRDGYQFKGKIMFDFYAGDRLVMRRIATQSRGITYQKNYATSLVTLTHFDLPLPGNYRHNLKLRATVLKPDPQLQEYENLKLFVGVDSSK